MVTLYYSPGACSLASHIVLEEAGIPFEAHRIVLASGEQHSPEYLTINPQGRVPALRTNGAVVTENVAVLTYIAALSSGGGALPKAPLQLARVYELLSFFASSVHIAFAQYWRPERFTGDESLYAAIRDGGMAALLGYFGDIEGMIEGRDWFVGDGFTVADTYPFVFARWGRRIGADMDAYPCWEAHTRRMLARPAVVRALAREGLRRDEFLPAKAAA